MQWPTARTTAEHVGKWAALLLATAAIDGRRLAQAEPLPCEPPGRLVRIVGKIFNNALNPEETLGVARARIARGRTLHCGVHGQAKLSPAGALEGFIHQLVCDDRVPVPGSAETIHSQLTLDSHFDGVPAFEPCGMPGVNVSHGSFQEISYPEAGRGIFSTSGGGTVWIRGTLDCAGAINMRFSGKVCLISR